MSIINNIFGKSGKLSYIKKTLKTKIGKDKEYKKKMSIFKYSIHILHRFITVCLRIFFNIAYGEEICSMPPITDLTLLEPATSLAHKIRANKLTCVQVMNSFIQRIKDVNPCLNCVVDNRFEEAMEDAVKADALIASGKYSTEQLEEMKPFLGVPISTKDCIMVKGMLHTAGLYKRRHIRANKDADVIALMREAGAIPFALTNVSECCMWWESNNTVHGRTNNPYNKNRIVGGSSGGEGCVQAAAASPFGIGSDIGGSIRMPAFFNGIFGHKPSRNIVSNEGQYPRPLCKEQDSFLGIGPMSRYAVDLLPMLKILAQDKKNLLQLDEPVNLNKLKFYYQDDDNGGFLVSPVETEIKLALHKVVKHFENVFKTKVKKIKLDKFKESTEIWFANMKSDKEIGFDMQLANLEGRVNPFWEIIKLVFGKSEHTLIGLITAIVEKYGIQYGTKEYKNLVTKRDELFEEMQTILGSDGVFLYPTHPTAAPYHTEPLLRGFNFSYTGIINVLGFPATSVPLGLNKDRLPIGIQIIANINNDRICLAVARELERVFGGWVPPTILA